MRIPVRNLSITLTIPLIWGAVLVVLDRREPLDVLGVRIPPITEALNHLNYDLLLRYRSVQPALDSRLVFLAIDDKTLDRLGQDPLPRDVHARLLRALRASDAQAATVWDILFVGPEKEDREFSESLEGQAVFLAIGSRLLALREDEKSLTVEQVEMLKRFRVGPIEDVKDWNVPRLEPIKAQSVPALLGAASGAGHIAKSVDLDSICRRVPVVVRVGNILVPSLSFAAALRAMGVPPDDLTLRGSGLIVGAQTLEQPVRIPLDQDGCLLVNFLPDWVNAVDWRSYGAQLITLEQTLKMKRLMDELGEEDQDVQDVLDSVRGKAMVVGEVLPGGSDYVPTPLDPMLPGALVHFNVLNTILTGQFITPAPVPLVRTLTLLLPIVLAAVFLVGRPLLSLLGAVLVLGSFFAGAVYLFWHGSYFLPVSAPMMSTALTGVTLVAVARMQAHKRATTLATVLSRFVSPTLLRELERFGSGKTLPGVQRLEISIMFVDVAGFTSFSDRTEPEEISNFLAELYEVASLVLNRNKGTLDKFLGDGILAYFGAPDPLPNKEELTIQAGLELQQEFDGIRQKMVKRGGAELRIRCGVTTGYAAVGYFGGHKHAAYTIVGRAVNLASRVQSNAEPGAVLIDKRTAVRVEEVFELERLEPIVAKGIDKPVEVWKVLRRKPVAAGVPTSREAAAR